jgi:hypothetical protein
MRAKEMMQKQKWSRRRGTRHDKKHRKRGRAGTGGDRHGSEKFRLTPDEKRDSCDRREKERECRTGNARNLHRYAGAVPTRPGTPHEI